MNNEWLSQKLSDILQFPVPQDMVEYISSITNPRDMEDYMKTLLDFENPQHKRFLQELLQKRQASSVGYKKSEVEEVYIAPKAEKKKKEKGNKSDNSKKEPSEQQTQTQSKKKKYVNLYSQDGRNRDVVLLKGRHKCECQASRHRLINNCLKCGRIVCEQEGSGPCLFCSSLVCSREEQDFINEGTKQSNHLLQKLMHQKVPGLEEAIAQRNRLLEYDRTSEMRTQVIDDESDYFSVNSVWLSPRQREELKKKEDEMQAFKHRSQMKKVYTLDMSLKQMIEGKPADEFDMSKLNKMLSEINKTSFPSGDTYFESDNIDPASDMHPTFDENVIYDAERGPRTSYSDYTSQTKVQDREFLEMVDDGLCMSLHQPWASLLVCGIKLHEGRNWYTSHRGRLWIASAAKPATEQDIKDVEKFYESVKGSVIFPLTYPTGCLLGCVNIVNCLPQDEYSEKFPNGESSSPFVFICDTPQELPIHFPVSGKHKIYKLQSTIHQAAIKAFQRLAKIKSDKNSISFLRNS